MLSVTQPSRTRTLYISIITLCILLLYGTYIMYYNNVYIIPFCYSIISGLSTCLGAIIVIFSNRPIVDIHLAYTCGLATGVMVYISIIDMLLPALYNTYILKGVTIGLFFSGAIFIYVLIRILPEADLINAFTDINNNNNNNNNTIKQANIAEIEIQPMMIDIEAQQTNNNTYNHSNSLLDIMDNGMNLNTLSPRKLATLKTKSEPIISQNNDINNNASVQSYNTRTLRFGIITCIVLGIHNLPEGLSVFITSLDNHSNGILMTIAISIHNIAEGLVVAVPIYSSTHNIIQTILLTTLSGITEPLGALLSITLFSKYLTHTIVQYCIIFVSGIMFSVSLTELLPEGLNYNKHNYFVGGIVSGVVVMAIAIYLAEL